MKLNGWDHALKVTATGEGLVGHAGAILLRTAADVTGLTSLLSGAPEEKGKSPLLDRGTVLVLTAAAIALGATSMSDVALLRHLAPLSAAGPRPGHPHRPADGIDWPHAARVLRIRRDAGPTRGPWESKEIAYGITSLPAGPAGPRHLAIYARNHWAIENREHQASKTLRRFTTLQPRCGYGRRACLAWRQRLSC
jgi:hypothetical protein